ncbi:MAG TPA: GTP-binding protein [Candidatus Brocadiia bacterium]|nr:GTP-binding protein [Candidatus Brocadiia bacterium]
MGLMSWLGLGGPKRPPIPVAVVAGISGSGRKSLINKVIEALGPGVKVCVVLYDAHAAENAIAKADNVCVNAYASSGGAQCPCHGSPATPIRDSVRKAAQTSAPDYILVQVGRGKMAREVIRDLLNLGALVKFASMTAVINAQSGMNDLRDSEDELTSFVRAAGQTLVTQPAEGQEWALEAVRKKVAEISPKTVFLSDEAKAAANIKGQLEAAKTAA